MNTYCGSEAYLNTHCGSEAYVNTHCGSKAYLKPAPMDRQLVNTSKKNVVKRDVETDLRDREQDLCKEKKASEKS